MKNKRFIKTLLLIIVVTFLTGFFIWKDYNFKQAEKKRQETYAKILESASTFPTELTIDYQKVHTKGSPLIFGGSHAPEAKEVDAWNKVASVGVTMIRKDFWMDKSLPEDITLEDYKANKNDIQNPQNWIQTEVNRVGDIYKNAKTRNIKTMGIVDYAPKWLTYSNTIYGVPKDWDVFEDLVKKSYRLYRNDLDYLEIWNEPNFDYFLDLTNSPYTREEAYENIYYHAAKAIREVDNEVNDGKKIPLGGPVSYNPTDTTVIEVILNSERTRDNVNFISYHNYDKSHLEEPSDGQYRSVLAKYHREELPVFLTEWNYDPNSQGVSPFHTSPLAITYTGNKFVEFLKMSLDGATYHWIQPLDQTLPDRGEGRMGFYRTDGVTADLLPQSRTWRLLSKEMGLGNGQSDVFLPEKQMQELNGIGFTNSLKQRGVVVVNASSMPTVVNIHLKNLPYKENIALKVYYASADDNATVPVYKGVFNVKDKNVFDFPYYIPEETVMGIVIEETTGWYFIQNFFN